MVEQLLAERPWTGLRSVQAILRLGETVGDERLEAACARALFYGDGRYRRIKDILNAALDQAPLPDQPAAAKPPATFAFQRPAAEFFPAESEEARC